jgi:hypothetical protein
MKVTNKNNKQGVVVITEDRIVKGLSNANSDEQLFLLALRKINENVPSKTGSCNYMI